MTILAIPNDRYEPRLGVVISRKVARTAVARNRIKRLVRESFRYEQQQLGSLDIVVIGRPGITRQTNRVITESLDKLWKKLIKTCAAC
jgi:ribonuclease P protein component